MQSVNSVLAGFQESLLPEVERFWIENPDPRQLEKWKYGDPFQWNGKTGTVVGGVIDQPHLRYCQFDDGHWDTLPIQELEPYTPEQPPHPQTQTQTPSSPALPHTPHPTPHSPPPNRRHSKKGNATRLDRTTYRQHQTPSSLHQLLLLLV
ncbi:MAG: hypothetical protein HC866_19620 [Leptolyngbyaceae cyanobacterium RU_5_1]|nr:hypothetical protein [Leptolyngbyaceae cyanobacterium RU_5_1]